jgi:hypothetical protein
MTASGHTRPSRDVRRTAELLLAEADLAEFSKAVELALFYDAKLVLT